MTWFYFSFLFEIIFTLVSTLSVQKGRPLNPPLFLFSNSWKQKRLSTTSVCVPTRGSINGKSTIIFHTWRWKGEKQDFKNKLWMNRDWSRKTITRINKSSEQTQCTKSDDLLVAVKLNNMPSHWVTGLSNILIALVLNVQILELKHDIQPV